MLAVKIEREEIYMEKISFGEIGAVVATFCCGDDVEAGAVVQMDSDKTVCGCDSGDDFCGVALSSGTYAGVQLGGFVTVATTGTLAVGRTAMVANGTGGVKADSSGESYLVVSAEDGSAVLYL